MSYGTIDKLYVSTINYLDQREILDQLVDTDRSEYNFMDVMEMMGNVVQTDQHIYRHFVTDDIYQTETISGAVTDNSGGSGQGDITFDVANASGTSVLRVGDLVLFASGYIGYVYDWDADAGGDIVKVKAVNTSVTTALLAAADTQKIAVISFAAGEGSDSPSATRVGVTPYANQVQIFKEAYKTTDVQAVSTIEFEVNGQPYYIIKQQHDALMKFRSSIAYAMLFGQISDDNFVESSPSLTDASSNPVQTTRGLREYITTYGINNTSVTFNLTYLQNLSRELDKLRSPQQYLVIGGIESNIVWDDVFNSLNATTQISEASRFSVDGNRLELGTTDVRLYGRDFMFKKMSTFDNPNILNFTGSAGFQKDMYFVPLGKINTIGGGGVDRMRVRYMPVNGQIYDEVLTGRLSPTKNSSESVLKVDYQSIMGLEVLGATDFARASLA